LAWACSLAPRSMLELDFDLLLVVILLLSLSNIEVGFDYPT
jgi:hypothetical protein